MRTWTTVDMASPAGAFMTNQARCRCVQSAQRDAAILGCKRWRWALDWRSLPFRQELASKIETVVSAGLRADDEG